ncbi:hypothetical protein ACWCY6_42515 [Streptomyces sp. 900105755]
MESQSWRNLGVEYRRPALAGIVISAVLYYLLHPRPEIPELAAACIALAALDCIRIRRNRTVIEPLELEAIGMTTTKRQQRARPRH